MLKKKMQFPGRGPKPACRAEAPGVKHGRYRYSGVVWCSIAWVSRKHALYEKARDQLDTSGLPIDEDWDIQIPICLPR